MNEYPPVIIVVYSGSPLSIFPGMGYLSYILDLVLAPTEICTLILIMTIPVYVLIKSK